MPTAIRTTEHFSLTLPEAYLDATEHAFARRDGEEELVIQQIPNDPPIAPRDALAEQADRVTMVAEHVEDESRDRVELGPITAHVFSAWCGAGRDRTFTALASAERDATSLLHVRYIAGPRVSAPPRRWSTILGSLRVADATESADATRDWRVVVAGDYRALAPRALTREPAYQFADPSSEATLALHALRDPATLVLARQEVGALSSSVEQFDAADARVTLAAIDPAGGAAPREGPSIVAQAIIDAEPSLSWRVRVVCDWSDRVRIVEDARSAMRSFRRRSGS